MRSPTGYATIVEPDRPTVERDTITCGHCQRAIFVKPHTAATVYLILDRRTLSWREEAGAFCRVCMRPVCLSCHAHGRCTPWEQLLEASEARERFCQQAGIRG
jgi:hypothetical protein